MVSTEDKLTTIDELVSTEHREKKKGERIVFYLKERCNCGGRIAVGSYRDMETYEIMVGGGVCDRCFKITRLPNERYVDFVEKYCEGGETMSALACKLCGGKVVIDDYSLNEAAPFKGQCEDCGEPHLFPAEDVWPVVVEMAIAKEVK